MSVEKLTDDVKDTIGELYLIKKQILSDHTPRKLIAEHLKNLIERLEGQHGKELKKSREI